TSAAPPTSAPPQAVTSPRATQLGKGGRRAEVRPTVLASPEGTCTVSDVSAEPTVKGNAYAGQRVVFAVELTSRISPACTLTIGPSTLVLRLTSGSDRIWSTQDCRASVPTRKVVVRRDVPATVPVTWNGQRSDPGCTHSTSWAEPGYYHATAAVLGADPADRQFELRTPPRPVVTKSPKPNKPTPKGKPSASPSR
ncbi:MAG: hypothetical protein HOQ22_01855, partial [Nocardioidaceae bacterium]|nr:hypothetical protein [Nocardioidaceae bacterium]